MSTPTTEFPFPALQHASGPVPLAAIDSAIEAVVADPNLIQVIFDRYREITAEPYTITTFEYCYLPYILTRAAQRLPTAQAEKIHTWLVDELVIAGDLDDDAMLEFLMRCGQDIGPPILPATLKAFHDPLFDSSAGAWFHLGGLAEVVCESNDPAIRHAFAELSLKFLRHAADGVIENDAVPHFAYIAASLKLAAAAPLLEKLINESGFMRGDYEEDLAILKGQQPPYPAQKRDLHAELLHQKKLLEKWYQERPADWNEIDFEEESEDDLSPLPDLFDEPSAPFLGDDFPYQEPYRNPSQKIGRNDPCPCGSGKKFKKCCGK